MSIRQIGLCLYPNNDININEGLNPYNYAGQLLLLIFVNVSQSKSFKTLNCFSRGCYSHLKELNIFGKKHIARKWDSVKNLFEV